MEIIILLFCLMEMFIVIQVYRVTEHQQNINVLKQERAIKNNNAQKHFYHDTIYHYFILFIDIYIIIFK